jgi:hypothetical protein
MRIAPKGAQTKKEIAMKVLRNQFAAFAVAMIMVMLTVVSIPAVVYAQSEMKVTIPFDFYIGSQRFPAGNYIVEVTNMYVRVSDREGHNAYALTNAVDNPESRTLKAGKLLFTRYDNYFFLSEVRRAGYTAAHGLIRSHLEAQIAKSSVEREQLAFGATK